MRPSMQKFNSSVSSVHGECATQVAPCTKLVSSQTADFTSYLARQSHIHKAESLVMLPLHTLGCCCSQEYERVPAQALEPRACRTCFHARAFMLELLC